MFCRYEYNRFQKNKLRNYLIIAANKYSSYLIGKDFLILSDNYSVFTISFTIERFKHLTGITTNLSERNFYSKCRNGTLLFSDIETNQHYDFNTLKKKCKALSNIDKFLYADAKDTLIINNLRTNTRSYKLTINNLSQKICICFHDVVNIGWSLRTSVNFDNCSDTKKVIAIFSKNKNCSKYSNIVYISNIKSIYKNFSNIEKYLSKELKDKFSYII
ncbi:MAG: PBECR4 domain-containing protein [Candidatus Gastranaerophilaceae bacterium]